MEAKFEAQCAACRGLIKEGEEINWLAPSGDLPALTKHVVCPEKKVDLHRINLPQKDAETRWTLRDCPECGHTWALEKHEIIMPTRCHDKEAAERERRGV